MVRKINFTKVEEELSKALERMNVERLLELATLASLVKKQKGEQGARAAEAEERVKEHLFGFLRGEVESLRKKDPRFLSQVAIDEEEYIRFLEHPESLASDDWQKIQEMREKITEYAHEVREQLPPKKRDKEIIKAERKKHINKRFNVRDDWLPLK